MRSAHALLLALAVGCGDARRAPTGPPNLIVVSWDTVRADRIGAEGGTRGLTPNLDAFAAEATVFTSAWAQANTTAMSHASLFTGRYPSELGTPGPRFTLGSTGTTVAEALHAYAYDSAAFTGGLHLSPGWGLGRGFDEFYATAPLGSFWHTLPATATWLSDREAEEGPFFLFVHGYDAHSPYLDPAPYGTAWTTAGYKGEAAAAVRRRIGTELVFDGRLFHEDDMLGLLWDIGRVRPRDAAGRAAVRAASGTVESEAFGDEDARYVRDVYDGSVAYADALFGWWWGRVRDLPAMQNTVVVVLADHGEALGEEGRFGHGDSLADGELQVPLVIRGPAAAGRRVDADVALIDVLPTLLDYAGATLPAGAHGNSLRPWVEAGAGPTHAAVFAEGSLREISARSRAGRLTFSGVGASSPYLPALLASARDDDPAWGVDSALSDATAAPALRAALLAWRKELTVLQAATPVDPQLIQEAKDHGYFTP